MQHSIQNFIKSSIVFKKAGILSEKLKLWQAPTTIELNTFCSNFAHVSYLLMSTKGISGYFYFV